MWWSADFDMAATETASLRGQGSVGRRCSSRDSNPVERARPSPRNPGARLGACLITAALCCAWGSASSLAAPAGTPDSTFGTGGVVTYQLGFGNYSPFSRLFAVTPAPGAKIDLAGDAGDGLGHFQVLSARLQENGSLDPSFGSSGYVLSEPPVGQSYPGQYSEYANAAAVQPDGSLVVAGNVIERLTPSGQFDPSFGPVVGVVTERNALRQLPDGKLLVLASEGGGDPTDAAEVERALPNGQPDPSFGKNGVTKLPLRPVNYSHMEATAETGVPGGSMIIAGKGIYYDASGEHIHLYLWFARLGPNGALDTSFGTNGFVYVEQAYADPEILLDSGDLVLLGMSTAPRLGEETSDRMIAWGFTLQGTRNPAFGNGGVSVVATTTGYNCGEFAAATVDPSGRLLLAGLERAIGLSAPEVPVLVRLSPNGSLDTSFGTDGYAFGPPHTWFRAVAIDPRQRVVVAGTQAGGVEEDKEAFVERFLSKETTPAAKEPIPEPKPTQEAKESIPASPPPSSQTGGQLSRALSARSARVGELEPTGLALATLPRTAVARATSGTSATLTFKVKASTKSLAVTITTSQAGIATITGPGLKKTVTTLTPGSHKVTVPLTKTGQAKRKQGKTIKLTVSLKTAARTASATEKVKL
jgi:uncharacterized delta-60 repeat protein